MVLALDLIAAGVRWHCSCIALQESVSALAQGLGLGMYFLLQPVSLERDDEAVRQDLEMLWLEAEMRPFDRLDLGDYQVYDLGRLVIAHFGNARLVVEVNGIGLLGMHMKSGTGRWVVVRCLASAPLVAVLEIGLEVVVLEVALEKVHEVVIDDRMIATDHRTLHAWVDCLAPFQEVLVGFVDYGAAVPEGFLHLAAEQNRPDVAPLVMADVSNLVAIDLTEVAGLNSHLLHAHPE